MSKTETLHPFVREGMEVIKEIGPDNKIAYLHPMGGVIHTHSLSLCDLLYGWIGKAQGIINIMGDDAYKSGGYIFEDVLHNMEQQLDEICHLIKKDIGDIEIDLVSHFNHFYRSGRILSARIIKKAPEKADDQTGASSPDQDRSDNSKESLHIEK